MVTSCNMNSLEMLKDNVLEFFKEASEAELNKSYNTASTLYFKAIVVAVDYFILDNEKFIPKNHTERFIILKEKYPNIYLILDKDFPLYQKTYNLKAKKQEVDVLKNDAIEIIKISGIEI